MALEARDDPRVRRVLGRRADDERGLPRQRVQVAELRRPRLRGADPQAERRRLPRADRAADHLRHRLAHGADRPQARARPGRVPPAAPHAGRRSDGQRPALAEQRRQGGAGAARRAPALDERARSGRRAAARTGTACAAPAWRSAAGSRASSRRAPRSGSTRRLAAACSPARWTSPARTSRWRRSRPSAYGVDIDKVRITTGDTDTAPLTGLSAGSKTIYTVGAAVMRGGGGRAPPDARDRGRGAGGLGPRPRDRGRQGRGPRRARPLDHARPDRQEGQPLHVEGAAGARREPSRLRGAGAGLRRPARADRGRPGHRRGHAPRLRGRPGRRARRSTRSASRARCRAARSRASGIALTEALLFDDEGAAHEPEPARLPQAHRRRPAEHRDDHRRGARRPPARSARAASASRPIVPAPAAIANAVEDATGVRITELPLTPERIAMALAAGQGNGHR